MNQEAAAVALIPVPAAEIIRSMLGIKQPFKVDRGHIANYPVPDEFSDLSIMRSVPIVEGYPQAASRLLDRVEDGLTFLCVNGQRFLSDDITAHFHCLDNIDVMSAVDTGNQDN